MSEGRVCRFYVNLCFWPYNFFLWIDQNITDYKVLLQCSSHLTVHVMLIITVITFILALAEHAGSVYLTL